MEEDLSQYIVTCRSCGGSKIRRPAGVFGNGKDRRWVDQHGKLWNGRKCPECNRIRAKNTMKRVRKAKANE
jgi:ssDNA-binding Zn-finger/Zn-ribbon topoisomerase 1